MSFKEELESRAARAEAVVLSYLPKAGGERDSLQAMIRYNMEAGGKRIRPLLLMETCKMYGGDPKEAGAFMAALEMIHTHSLVHDDLPALDNDDYRRGRRTSHKVFGEAAAILAGDALLNLAYETISRDLLDKIKQGAALEKGVKALDILTSHTGYRGMLGGQSLDVKNEKKGNLTPDGDQLLWIYEKKTSSLLSAAMMVGACLAGGSDETLKKMGECGRAIGLAFQIQDDILDKESRAEVLGKPVGSDEKNEKVTYVTLFGIEEARKQVAGLTEKAKQCLPQVGSGFIRELADYLIIREK